MANRKTKEKVTQLVSKQEEFFRATEVFGGSTERFSLAVATFDAFSQVFGKDFVNNLLAAAEKMKESSEEFDGVAKQQVKREKEKEQKEHRESMLELLKQRRGYDALQRLVTPLIGKMKELVLRFAAVFTLTNIMAKFIAAFTRFVKAQEAVRISAARNFGIMGPKSVRLQNNLQMDRFFAGIGRTEEDAISALVAANESLKGAVPLMSRQISDVANAALRLNTALGLDEAAAGGLLGQALRFTNASAKDVIKTLDVVVFSASQLDLNIQSVANQIANFPTAMRMFRAETDLGRNSLASAAIFAEKIGSNLRDLKGIGEKFFSIESTVGLVSRLRQLGIGISVQEIQRARLSSDPAALAKLFVERINANYAGLEASFGDVQDIVRSISDATGLDMDVLSTAIRARISPAEIDSELERLRNRKSLGEESKDYLQKISESSIGFGQTLDMIFNQLAYMTYKVIQPFVISFLTDFAPKVRQTLDGMLGVLNGVFGWIARIVRKFSGPNEYDSQLLAAAARAQGIDPMTTIPTYTRSPFGDAMISGSKAAPKPYNDLLDELAQKMGLSSEALQRKLDYSSLNEYMINNPDTNPWRAENIGRRIIESIPGEHRPDNAITTSDLREALEQSKNGVTYLIIDGTNQKILATAIAKGMAPQ